MSSPAKRRRLSAQRKSMDGRKSVGVAAPRTALRTSTSGANRNITSHSVSYDIITGEPIEPTKQRRLSQSQIVAPASQQQPLRRSTSRQSMLPKPEQPVQLVSQSKHQDEILALQAQIHKLDYEKTNLKSEHDMFILQHEKDLREMQARTDAEHRRYEEAEAERLKALRQCEIATKEIREARDGGVNEKAALDRRLRDLQTKYESLQEDKEDLETRLADADREVRRLQVEEVGGKTSKLERTLQETQSELDEMRSRFDVVNTRLNQKEQEADALEAKVLDLSGKTGGSEELEVLKRELSEQIAYVRRIENQVRDQNTELRKLRDERRSINVVVEEKRALEVQLQAAKEVETRVGELEIQKEILEDEKRMWTSLLESGTEGGQQEFDTPEAVVKSLVNERIEHAMLLERVGREEAEAAGKDEALRALQSERDALQIELAKAKGSAKPAEELSDGKALKRVERQLQLAQKEVVYLRAQIETFNAEETTMMENANFDTQRVEQIQNLQKLVDDYKSETQTLQAQITTLESQAKAEQLEARGTKRAADSQDADADSQTGQLQRKNKNLQVALQKSTLTSQQLAKELQATKSQLKALRNSAATRVLELRDNPTAQHAAIKMSTLRTLTQENTDLLVQLRGNPEEMSSVKVVPVSTLDALKLDLKDMESVVAEKDKRMRRQREIWTEKAREFRDVIASILGYKVYFMPNGKVKVSSLYYRDRREGNQEEEEVPEEDREDYIMFDADKGTMKTGGGRDGQFGKELEQLTDFWIRERNEIPCFLAAMTLEFYEKYGTLNG